MVHLIYSILMRYLFFINLLCLFSPEYSGQGKCRQNTLEKVDCWTFLKKTISMA